MKRLIFEWDDTKNKTNQAKHRVSFEEAETMFFDEKAIEFDDPDHSIDEERFLLLGFSQNLKTFGRVPLLSRGRLNNSTFCVDIL